MDGQPQTGSRRASVSGLAAAFILAVFLSGAARAVTPADARDIDPRAWADLAIVPMPKQIRLTDRDEPLLPDRVVLVTGEQACRQSRIGAEWVNQRIVALGGRVLAQASERDAPDAAILLIVGTATDCPPIARAVDAGLVDVGERNPGQRGYEIRSSMDGRRVYLAGADPVGALYACVTFGELLEPREGRVVWRSAEVRDWPDAIHVQMGDYAVGDTTAPEVACVLGDMRRNSAPTAEQREAYLRAFRRHYDELLRRKITLLGYGVHLKGHPYSPRKGMDVVREGIRYGTDRGIGAILYAESPFVGLRQHYPELWDSMPEAFKGVCREWVRSWSMDEARRETAEDLARHVARLGITHIGFHDTDTGSYGNPCQWNDRSDADRQRWGDDFAGATAHKLRIYYDALKHASPDIRIIFTQYPYSLAILEPGYEKRRAVRRLYGPNADHVVGELREKTVRFWRDLHQRLPMDVSLAIRETTADAVRRFRALIPGRAVYTWLALQGSVTQNRLYGEGARWSGTFCRHPDDIVAPRACDIYVPLNSLAVREYTWSVKTPGAGAFREQGGPDNDVFTLVLPRIARNIFGCEAGPLIAEALAPRVDEEQPAWNIGVIPHYVFSRDDTVTRIDPRLESWCNTPDRMAWQAHMADAAAQILDSLWQRCRESGGHLGMDEYGFRRFINLREVYHACRWMATIRSSELRAHALRKAEPAAALTAAREGLAVAAQARSHLAQLIAERPRDPILQRDDHKSYSGRTWRAFMADTVVLEAVERRLRSLQTRLRDEGG